MAWPPASLPTNRSNATPQNNTHPADHNSISAAINDTVGQLVAVTSAIASPGFIAIQSGQLIGTGDVDNLSWNTLSTTAFGTGPVFQVPTGGAGFYVCTLQVQGPQPPAGTFSDIVVNIRGKDYAAAIMPGKITAAVCAGVGCGVGDQIFAKVYNSTVADAFYIASLEVRRVAV